MTEEHDLLDIARRNHSLIARHHVATDDAGRQRWRRARQSPRWEEVTHRVLRLAGSVPTTEQHVAAAVLDAGEGAALYGVSAAAHWGLAGFVHSQRYPVHVIRPARAKRVETERAIVHTTARSVDPAVCSLRDIAVSTPVQMYLDLARTLSVPRLDAAIDRGLRKRIISTSQLRDSLESIARSGRDGVVSLRAALENKPHGYIPTESNLESRLDQLVNSAGLGRFRRQVEVGGAEPIGRVDFLHAFLPLIIEVNSEEFHAALVDELADAVRYEALHAAGFEVVPVVDTDVWHAPESVISAIAEAVSRLRRAA